MLSAGAESGGDDADSRKYGKRELSTSKRAAQNRAAQVGEPLPVALEGSKTRRGG